MTTVLQTAVEASRTSCPIGMQLRGATALSVTYVVSNRRNSGTIPACIDFV